ncbi:MAG: TauD/TfdA dioxygenase family protein [Gammaproteobacteria bacterium]
MSNTFEVEPLPGGIGVALAGWDFRQPLPQAHVERFRALFFEHRLVVIRGQALDGADQVRITGYIGPVCDETGDGAGFGYVSHRREDAIVRRNTRLPFHIDLGFHVEPNPALSLYAIEYRGDAPTLYADTVRSCAGLAESLRARIAGRKVVNVSDFSRAVFDTRIRLADLGPQASPAIFPRNAFDVICRHPVTGVEYLRSNELMSSHVEGMNGDASEALLAEVFAHMYQPRFVHAHQWQEHDLVLWDNYTMQHGRAAFDAGFARTLRRVVVHPRPMSELLAGIDMSALAAR